MTNWELALGLEVGLGCQTARSEIQAALLSYVMHSDSGASLKLTVDSQDRLHVTY